MQPLIGRTGIEFGKTFRGKRWEITALTLVYYQYDLLKPGVTTFKALVGNTYINNGKDSRVVFNIGLNTNLKENAREGANKQVISSQADSLIKISRIWADFFPANTSNQPI